MLSADAKFLNRTKQQAIQRTLAYSSQKYLVLPFCFANILYKMYCMIHYVVPSRFARRLLSLNQNNIVAAMYLGSI